MDLKQRVINLINKLDVGQTERTELLQQADRETFEVLLAQIRAILEGLEKRYNAETQELEQELAELELQTQAEKKAAASARQNEEVEKARKKLLGFKIRK